MDGERPPSAYTYYIYAHRTPQYLLSALLAPPEGAHFYAPPLPAGKHNPKRYLQPQ